MCTLSFLVTAEGFALLMNRDEQRTRPLAFPPGRHACGRLSAWYPTEPGGGTWIGINSRGLALALLNSYAHPHRAGRASRGLLIPQLLGAEDGTSLESELAAIDLGNINPFRLVAVAPESATIREFLWGGRALARAERPWRIAHWFSSAFDEPGVLAARAATVRTAGAEREAGTLPWARRLHATHQPERGPYSICLHRKDATTVSCTEITWDGASADLHYRPGPPCRRVTS